MMDLTVLQTLCDGFVSDSPWNRVMPEEAIAPELAGTQLFDAPLVGCSQAEDPLYLQLQRPEAVGPAFRLPDWWLPGARSVLSFFFPFTQPVRQSNRGGTEPSALWLHGRIEGQRFLERFAGFLLEELQSRGIRAVAPVLSEAFRVNNVQDGEPFGSNWSERHVAYISGLGTFGLSKGIITEKGMAGRLISLVTDAPLPATPRNYTERYEYCIRCGACAKRCPAGAIVPERGMEEGKAHLPCADYQNRLARQFAPRYGCGKCQAGVPCEDRIPEAAVRDSRRR